jgi:hypothetical protein
MDGRHDLDPAQRTHARRVSSGAAIGGLLGACVGFVAGLMVGALIFQLGSPGMWACVLAGGIFIGGVGAIWGAFSGLGSTDPGREPLQREHPLEDGRLVSEEHPGTPGERRAS